uniref:Uncharacterized protein n=1 Tax=Trichobilharzia regenti TaxID=157069 RepID=A0AA85J0B5_TRIRE|nr:unnamed protein product [Trichobilharzia regenti]
MSVIMYETVKCRPGSQRNANIWHRSSGYLQEQMEWMLIIKIINWRVSNLIQSGHPDDNHEHIEGGVIMMSLAESNFIQDQDRKIQLKRKEGRSQLSNGMHRATNKTQHDKKEDFYTQLQTVMDKDGSGMTSPANPQVGSDE